MRPRIFNQRRAANRGYTLVELLIAMVILVIAFLAVIASSVSTSQGYISARDGIQASELGRRVIELMHVEGDAWDERADQPFAPASGPYTSSPFTVTPRPVNAMVGAPWSWQVLFKNPVTVNMANLENVGVETGGRFCVYSRGANLGVADGPRAIQIQVAVVYSGSNSRIGDCENDIALTDLDLSSDEFPGKSIFEDGYRVRYFGTVITPK